MPSVVLVLAETVANPSLSTVAIYKLRYQQGICLPQIVVLSSFVFTELMLAIDWQFQRSTKLKVYKCILITSAVQINITYKKQFVLSWPNTNFYLVDSMFQ